MFLCMRYRFQVKRLHVIFPSKYEIFKLFNIFFKMEIISCCSLYKWRKIFLFFFFRRADIINLYDQSFSLNDGVRFFAMANKNYGPVYGIYIANGAKDTARNLCFAGSSRISNVMKTDESRTLGTFDCT